MMRWAYQTLVALLLSSALLANLSEDIYGIGPREKAMGQTGVAFSDGPQSLYLNPGFVGFSIKQIQLGFDQSGTRFDNFPSANTMAQGNKQFLELGATGFINPYIAWGFHVALNPLTPALLRQTTASDKAIFPLYDTSHNMPTMLVGFAFPVHPSFSFGGAISLGMTATVNQRADIGVIGTQQNMELDMLLNVEPTLAYYLGIAYRPTSWLQLGAVYRSSMRQQMTINADLNLILPTRTISDIDQHISGHIANSPAQIGIGAAVIPISGLLISADMIGYQWSKYNDNFIHITPLNDNYMSKAVNLPPREALKLSDIVAPRLGIEYTWKSILSMRIGYVYRPSPVLASYQHLTVIDADTHIVTGGLGGRIKLADNYTLGLDAYGSVQIIGTNASHKGLAYDTGVSVRLEY